MRMEWTWKILSNTFLPKIIRKFCQISHCALLPFAFSSVSSSASGEKVVKVSGAASASPKSLLSTSTGFIVESVFTKGKAFGTLSEVVAEAVVVVLVVSPSETFSRH